MQNNTTKFIALLNRLWDGQSFITHRKTSHNFIVQHRHLTVSLMLQPLVLQQLLAKNGGMSRQSGFLARSLLAYPESAMGNRYYQEPPSLQGLEGFQQRLIDCLDASLDLGHKGCKSLPTLHLSPPAKKEWIAFFNQIEAGLNESTHWSDVQDFASKAAENAARLAALFHLFEGKTGLISLECIEQATRIITWHLLETRRILEPDSHSQQHNDAARLLAWIQAKSLTETTPSYVQQYSPFRDKTRRNKAIQLLIEHHYMQEIKTDGKITLLINPCIT